MSPSNGSLDGPYGIIPLDCNGPISEIDTYVHHDIRQIWYSIEEKIFVVSVYEP